MQSSLQHLLLLPYFVAYFLFAFVWRAALVYRRTGINPFVLPSGDDAHSFVGRTFKLLIVACTLAVAEISISPEAKIWLGFYEPLNAAVIVNIGWMLLIASLLWMLLAQAQMGASWRIGIDSQRRAELVQHGLFRVSRNPIFLATRINLLGLFCVFPSAATFAILIAGEILIQVQVRLEEQHLLNMHDDEYRTYCARVRRWL